MESISIRLKAIADLVPENSKVLDVGTDHGYLPIYLIKEGKAKSVIASDINEKPLEKAKQNIRNSGVKGITLRLCDGIENLENTNTVIIAGMGGEVISGILQRARNELRDKRPLLILQPTTSPEALRKQLWDNGFSIEKEVAVKENNKLYSLIVCRFTGEISLRQPWEYYCGLAEPRDSVGREYIEKQKNRIFKCMTAIADIEEKREEYIAQKEIFEGLESRLKQE